MYNAWQRSRTQNLRKVGKSAIRFYTVCKPKFTKFSECVGNPVYFPTPLPHCLCHVSLRRYLPLSFEVVEKTSKCQSFLTPNFWEGLWTSLTFLPQIVSAVYCPPFGKVWLSSVCWSPSAKTGNEVEYRIYGG